jgi:hypothetical protein
MQLPAAYVFIPRGVVVAGTHYIFAACMSPRLACSSIAGGRHERTNNDVTGRVLLLISAFTSNSLLANYVCVPPRSLALFSHACMTDTKKKAGCMNARANQRDASYVCANNNTSNKNNPYVQFKLRFS